MGYANLTHVVDFLGAFGLSSAEAERGFSQMKSVKTDKRACVGQIPFQDQRLVKLEGPAIHLFDPVPSIRPFPVQRLLAGESHTDDCHGSVWGHVAVSPVFRKSCRLFLFMTSA